MSISVGMHVQYLSKCYVTRIIRTNKRSIRIPVLLFKRDSQTSQHELWIEPKGYETGISVYNSLSKSKVPFKTVHPGFVSWYNCGPTVYDSSHIGHALSYVRLDIIRRIMQDIFQLNVVKVTGITDIDDKIINRAKELNTCVTKLAQKYEREFFQDMEKLYVLPPSLSPRVTDHIPQIISFVSKILEKGFAYCVGEGTVYFDTASFSRYGKLVRLKDDELLQISAHGKKKCTRDFALWKGAKVDDVVFWESPWGAGRPGWHIECSAMACQIFGEKLDLHSGGTDLLFPHHENEEAQCCAHHSSDQWCNYWIHTGHLHVKGTLSKMSKSLKNTIGIETFLKDYSANAFRILCLFSHYRSHVEFTSDSMKIPKMNLNKIISFFQDSQAYVDGCSSSGPLDEAVIMQTFMNTQRAVREHLADDFNTKLAMTSLLELISVCHKELTKSRRGTKVGRSVGAMAAVRGYIQHILISLGIKFKHQLPLEKDVTIENEQYTQVLDSALALRDTVKRFALFKGDQPSSQFCEDDKQKLRKHMVPLLKACDKMRDEFREAGVLVKDYDGAATWSLQKGTQVIPKGKGSKEEGRKEVVSTTTTSLP